jgi:hypothetical protein
MRCPAPTSRHLCCLPGAFLYEVCGGGVWRSDTQKINKLTLARRRVCACFCFSSRVSLCREVLIAAWRIGHAKETLGLVTEDETAAAQVQKNMRGDYVAITPLRINPNRCVFVSFVCLFRCSSGNLRNRTRGNRAAHSAGRAHDPSFVLKYYMY